MRDHRDHGGPPREPGGPAPASAGPRNPGHDAAAVRPDDAAPAPRSLDEAVARMARLEAELVEAQAAAAATQDQFLRERAELENYKRRMQKDKAESLRYATEPVLRDLIGVIDNLERAIKAAREEAAREGGPWARSEPCSPASRWSSRNSPTSSPATASPGSPPGTSPSTRPTTRPSPRSRATSTRQGRSSRSTRPATGCTTACCARPRSP